MILGTGIDIVEIQRIEKLIKKDDAFKLKVFSEEEIIFCEKRSAESYAGRFAAKEAFMKALGVGWTSNSEFKEISVRADKLGKPYLHLSGKTAERPQKCQL